MFVPLQCQILRLAPPLSEGSKALQILLHLNKKLHLHDAALLLLVFLAELPVEHWALGCISIYGYGLFTFKQKHLNSISIGLKISLDVGG